MVNRKYILLKETTKWTGNIHNSTYILVDKPGKRSFKAVGYIGPNTDVVQWFKNGLDIYMKDRTFMVV